MATLERKLSEYNKLKSYFLCKYFNFLPSRNRRIDLSVKLVTVLLKFSKVIHGMVDKVFE